MPGNVLAWELYHEARLEGVGPLILELRQLDEMTPFEADELAFKLEVIGTTYVQIENEETKQAGDDAEMRRRMAGR